MSDKQLQELARYSQSDAFDPLEKCVLDYASMLSGTSVDVPDTVFEQLRSHLSPGQIVELTHAIIRGADRARMNRAFQNEAEGIPEAAYCLVRDTRAANAAEERGTGSVAAPSR